MGFRYLLAPLVFFALILGCKEQQFEHANDLAEAQRAYFPLGIGKYMDYQVDSVVFDFSAGGTVRDSTTTYVREIFTDTLRDQTGELQYVFEQYQKKSLNEGWEIESVGTCINTASQAIRTEGNWRFLKLIFPLDEQSSWNGNVWIDVDREIEIAGERIRPFSNWYYEVDSIDVPANIGSFSFDSTLLVTEADYTSAFERRFSRVRYAKDVGLVWREQWILDSQYCNQTPAPPDCNTLP